jgi:hypothetical protein
MNRKRLYKNLIYVYVLHYTVNLSIEFILTNICSLNIEMKFAKRKLLKIFINIKTILCTNKQFFNSKIIMKIPIINCDVINEKVI